MAERILLVEDDPNIRQAISDYLASNSNLALTCASDGNEGQELLDQAEYDLVLLDVMLPGIDGFSLCRSLRRKSDTPIIFLTARGREEDVLYGYDLGCDDYIVKPFSLATLLAKIHALLKRSAGRVLDTRITCGRIEMDPRRYQVLVDGAEVELPPKEYEILHFLLKNKEQVCTREDMLIRLWGYDYEGDERVLDNHMKKLRKALGKGGDQIKTVMRKGYKLVP